MAFAIIFVAPTRIGSDPFINFYIEVELHVIIAGSERDISS